MQWSSVSRVVEGFFQARQGHNGDHPELDSANGLASSRLLGYYTRVGGLFSVKVRR
jgi:hypothetical protein